ncbi:MAG: type III pantothenate kinase [Bacteroidetes bacterium]|nr:type III pantothenate kinase [Bacteroidota bacterium]
MNLIIDVGNSFIKLAVFSGGEIQHKRSLPKKDFINSLNEISKEYPKIDHCIISSVGEVTDAEISAVKKVAPVFILSREAKLPFRNQYATPETLGMDRISLVSAAALQFPEKNVLIIDAGSCITYDFLSAENNYLGGAISPGIEMRYKAMHTFTSNLPLLKPEILKNSVGDSTNNSMHIGVIQGVINELNGFVDEYKKNFSNLTVILTGGDAHFLRDSIKNDIFANSNFLLEGLNYILEINKDRC